MKSCETNGQGSGLAFLINSKGILFFLCALLLAACGGKEEAWPNVRYEMADGVTDAEGRMGQLVLDDGQAIRLANPQDGLKAEVAYRGLYGFAQEDGEARLYTFDPAYILRDSTERLSAERPGEQPATDPLAVVSVWSTPRYINLHLRPKTQGGTQYLGYYTDGTSLRLHHRQNGDPLSYSQDVYASIPWEDMEADAVTIKINTLEGEKEYILTPPSP